MKTLLIAFAMFATAPAFATPRTTIPAALTQSSVEVWEGPGSLISTDGKVLSTYTLVVTNTKTGNKIHSAVKVTLADGTVKNQSCEITPESNDSWQSACGQGKGGGRCFGDGLCISYEEDQSGQAYATNIVMDGTNDMRLLRTALNKGKAMYFFREKLHKK